MDCATASDPSDASPAVAPDSATVALLDFLSMHDVLCPLCSYNLRGLTVPRCPECGNGIRLTVGLVEVQMGAWICAIAGVLPAAPFGLLFCYAVLREGAPSLHNLGTEGLWVFFLMFYVVFAVPASAALLVFRRRFIRLPKALQGWLAAIVILIDIAAVLTFLAKVS
jgi:hypothetical protein